MWIQLPPTTSLQGGEGIKEGREGRGGEEGREGRGEYKECQAACAACSPQLEAHGCEFAVGAHVLPGGWGRENRSSLVTPYSTAPGIWSGRGRAMEWAGQGKRMVGTDNHKTK